MKIGWGNFGRGTANMAQPSLRQLMDFFFKHVLCGDAVLITACSIAALQAVQSGLNAGLAASAR